MNTGDKKFLGEHILAGMVNNAMSNIADDALAIQNEITWLRMVNEELLAACKNALESHRNELKYGGQVYTDDIELMTVISKAEAKGEKL